jgi:riboflavin synthase
VTVRDPADAIGRLTRWNSGTDGNSPDGRKHVARPGRKRAERLCSRVGASAAIPGACGRQVAPEENEVDAVFTGIVEELGEVVALKEFQDAARLTVRGALVTAGASAGDSIAINGVCLTVTDASDGTFSADVMGETLRRSSLGALGRGSAVNLERPLRLDSRLGGHLVQGHVDGTGTITERRPGERWDVVRISIPPQLARYVVEKGSIAVDGVSLTVSALGAGPDADSVSSHGQPDWIEVSLIPETLARTTLGRKQPGETVNLEVDMIAKYVERLLGGGRPQS